LTLSDKTKHNTLSTLHHFSVWLKKRQEINSIPDFPECPFELEYRRTVDKETQMHIIGEVRRICLNPNVYLGIKWLATYISVRPGALIKLTERNIDIGNGYLYIPHPKGKKPKLVPLLEEHVEIIRTFLRGVPALPFFRHIAGISGTRENEPFGARYLFK
jgi:integrase